MQEHGGVRSKPVPVLLPGAPSSSPSTSSRRQGHHHVRAVCKMCCDVRPPVLAQGGQDQPHVPVLPRTYPPAPAREEGALEGDACGAIARSRGRQARRGGGAHRAAPRERTSAARCRPSAGHASAHQAEAQRAAQRAQRLLPRHGPHIARRSLFGLANNVRRSRTTHPTRR